MQVRGYFEKILEQCRGQKRKIEQSTKVSNEITPHNPKRSRVDNSSVPMDTQEDNQMDTQEDSQSTLPLTAAELVTQAINGNLDQPVMVEFENPALHHFLTTRMPLDRKPLYLGDDLIARFEFSNSNLDECKGMVVFNLADSTSYLFNLNLSNNLLFQYFKTSTNKLIIIDADCIKIWGVKLPNLSLVHHIPLPKELTQHFETEIKSPITVKMFPDGQHMGILLSDSVFYLVDCEKGCIIRFPLGDTKYEQSLGFVPVSPEEIIVSLVMPKSYRHWYKVHLNKNGNFKIDPTPLEHEYYLPGDYNFYSLGKFGILDKIDGTTSYLDLYPQDKHKERFEDYMGHHPVNLPMVERFCFINYHDYSLRILFPQNQAMHEMKLPLEAKYYPRRNITSCDERAVLISDDISPTMQACIFPATTSIHALDTLPMPQGVKKIIVEYMKNPSCSFLQNTTVSRCTLFEPKSPPAFEPDLKQIHNLQDVVKTLGYFCREIKQESNQHMIREISACSFIKEKLNRLTPVLNEIAKGSFNPNSSGLRWIRQDYKDDSLFRDPTSFAQDFLRYLKKGAPDFPRNSGDYFVNQVIPYVIQKHQLDKIAEKAGQIIQTTMYGLSSSSSKMVK